jgi:chromosome segregation ATPase
VDTETRAYLDAALAGLRQEIRAGTAETAAMRQELRAEMAELRLELRTETGALRAETAELRLELRTETGALRAETAELRQELRTETGALRAETAGLRLELRAETGALRAETGALRAETAELRLEMRQTAGETRRHFDVVAESIRSDVRAVAEGVAANTEAIERLGTGLRAEMDARFTASHAIVRVALQELRRDIFERGPRSPL